MFFTMILGKTHILTMLYRSHLTIFSIDNQHEKGSEKNAMGWSTTAYFPALLVLPGFIMCLWSKNREDCLLYKSIIGYPMSFTEQHEAFISRN